jgi:polyhydroxyalkanoate synthesis repressor PhaR
VVPLGDERVDAPSRVIKRYANRKLYDTHASRYVTLHQIAEYVKAGEEVQIVDNTTKEDLTRVTLAQILYERERTRDVPEERKDRSLRDMIREGRERLLDTILESPMGKLVHRLDPDAGSAPATAPAADAITGQGDGVAAPDAAHANDAGSDSRSEAKEPRDGKDAKDGKRPAIHSPREALDELGRIADEQWRAILDGALHTVQQLQGEVQRLHSRIEELEGRLGAQINRLPKKDDDPPGE